MIPRALPRALVAVVGGAALLGAALFAVVVSSGGSVAAEALDPNVKPDATLSAGQTAVFKNATPLYGAEVHYPPHACRGEADTADGQLAPLICKAYRVSLNLDPSPKALNTVIFEALFDQTRVQSLPVGVAGLNPPPAGGVNIYVWDTKDHYLGENETDNPDDASPGGAGFSDREIGSFTAKQKLYDFVVASEAGVNSDFELRVTFSNELFKRPFEILDEISAPQEQSDVPVYTPPFVGGSGPGVVEPLPTLDIAPDSDIAGIGLGTTEQFDAAQRLALGASQARAIAAASDPPPAILLVLVLVIIPVLTSGLVLALLRQRRRALVV